jgi:hypothetical protein
MGSPSPSSYCYDSAYATANGFSAREGVYVTRQSVAFLAVPFLAVIMLCVGVAGQQHLAASQKQGSTKQEAAHANSSAPAVDTSAWKTYRNEKHGFQVKYPETWTVNAGSGTGPDIIAIGKRARGEEPNASLTMAIQKNQNPKKLSIEEWFADQMKLMHAQPESGGHITIGGQAAIFMENTNSFGKQRDTFTLLNETDILSLSYKHKAEFDATYNAIVFSFRVLK